MKVFISNNQALKSKVIGLVTDVSLPIEEECGNKMPTRKLFIVTIVN